MSLTDEEERALEHQKKLLQTRTRSLYILEEQEANYGNLNVPTHILSQIDKLTEQIKQHKEEINRLEMLSVQGQIPLAEVEYRMWLAEAWDTSNGYPTVIGRTKLEFARLRLHILPERAKDIEWNIRKELADEKIKQEEGLGNREYLQLTRKMNSLEYDGDERLGGNLISPLKNIIRLHPTAVLEHILEETLPTRRDGTQDLGIVIEYKTRWLELFAPYVPYDERDDMKRFFHQFLEPERPFDIREWDAIIPF